MRVTIKVKIKSIPELNNLSLKYLDAVQYCVDKCIETSPKHKFGLHHIVYNDLRKRFGLKSQFSIICVAKGFETYKSFMKLKGGKPIIKSAPIIFDKRLATFKWTEIRVATNDKRISIPINIANYYSKYFDWSFQTATLLNIKGIYYFHIVLSKQINIGGDSQEITGVDLGINNLAVCSDGEVFSTPKTKLKQFHYLRRKLQAKGTKSARRHLQKIRGRQKRFMANYNHIVSKKLVNNSDVIVFEDLTNIRKDKRKGKFWNRRLHGWAFKQLQSFTLYKANAIRKIVQFVSPYMTSQTCSKCLKIGNRYFDHFFCPHCGYSSQSDYNASCNLRRLYVKQPIVVCDDTKASSDELQLSITTSHTPQPVGLGCGI